MNANETKSVRVGLHSPVLSSIGLLFLIGGLGGCGTCEAAGELPRLCTSIEPTSEAFRAKVLRFADADARDAVAAKPPCLIDIHMHTFNANYGPIPEIIEASAPGWITRKILKSIVRVFQLSTAATLPEQRHERAAWKRRYVENGRTLTGAAIDERIAEFLR